MSYEFRTTVLKFLPQSFCASVSEARRSTKIRVIYQAHRMYSCAPFGAHSASCFDLQQLRFGTFGINIATLPGIAFYMLPRLATHSWK